MTYEIRPCHTILGEDAEECSPAEAQFWGVYNRTDTPDKYGHKLAWWVADRPTEEEAQELVELLIGAPA